jgi:aspartyl-tRNA(Asn)/glutamyl-tRNA(Gln) amidotransferase subunit A
MDDLAFTSAADLAAAFRERTLSPVEVAVATLARIDRLNPGINAYCHIAHESALADARASEARWAKGAPLSPLDGVPTGIKDLIVTNGMPTMRGSKTVGESGPWLDDAPAVARLREAGAVILGKTCTPEWGWKGATDSPLTGITRNPWNRDMTPGGSSGGASAALAAGLGPLQVGTDGGGSIRIPGSFTATTGIKAHFGRVPAWPLSPMGTVAHVGPMTRTVEDTALLLNVISRPDTRDWTALPPHGKDWTANLGDGLKGMRIAYSPRLGYVKYVHPEVEAAVKAAVQRFADLGAQVESLDPGFQDCGPLFATHWFATARNTFGKLPPEKFRLLDLGLQATCEYAARYTIADFLDYQVARTQVGEAMKRFNTTFDLLVTPATAVPAFEVGRVAPDLPPGVESIPEDWTWWTPFSYPFNLTQQPALSINCGFTASGLPIGLQIVAPAYREELALRAAAAFETARGPIDWPAR